MSDRCTQFVHKEVGGVSGLYVCGRPSVYWETTGVVRCAKHAPVDAITPDTADRE